jgi:hypothetical protein
MTIQDMGGRFVCDCDTCPEYLEVVSNHFADIVAEIKARGWKIYKDKNDKWSHKCIVCQERGR